MEEPERFLMVKLGRPKEAVIAYAPTQKRGTHTVRVLMELNSGFPRKNEMTQTPQTTFPDGAGNVSEKNQVDSILLNCTSCKQRKPLEAFHGCKSKTNRYGKSTECKPCNKIRSKNKEKRLNNASPERFLKYIIRACRTNAKKRKIFFNIKHEDVVNLWYKQEGKCAITQINLTHKYGYGKTRTNVSIDRINSDMGYTTDNIQLVACIVNLMKLDMSLAELQYWCKKITNEQV